MSVAVDGIDLHVGRGEFFSLLGPSGCGKTTTLRLDRRLRAPTSGRILIDGVDVARMPAHERNVNTVFQSYALFPFLSVFDNVAFGLKYRRSAKNERERLVRRGARARPAAQVREASPRAAVRRTAAASRPGCAALMLQSGGALARRTTRRARRQAPPDACRSSSSLSRRSVGITFLYVTHDQEEALTMSDRLAVMDSGRIAQVGTPTEVYEEPANAYVADFLGVSNLMEAQAVHGLGGSGGASCESANSASKPPVAPRGRRTGASGDPPRAHPDRGLRLDRTEPGSGDGGAARLFRVSDSGHSPSRTGRALQALVQNDGATGRLQPGHARPGAPPGGRTARPRRLGHRGPRRGATLRHRHGADPPARSPPSAGAEREPVPRRRRPGAPPRRRGSHAGDRGQRLLAADPLAARHPAVARRSRASPQRRRRRASSSPGR